MNYLYSREQIERMRARAAACIASRSAHHRLAERYHAVIQAQIRSARLAWAQRTSSRAAPPSR